ncbi:MAG: bifunctional nicotinamidase/pyrazinamidase [Phycisphaerales bacterium]
MKALLLVDIQNDFTPGSPGGALAVPNGDEVIAVANRLMPMYDLVVATQDWHPKGHKSFASEHAGHNVGDIINWGGLDQVLWPDHCVQGTPGAEFCPDLNTQGINEVVRKGTDPDIDSYSGFYDNGHRKATGLTGLLQSRGVTEVDVMGLATDYCVKFTALDAVREGFTTRVILEGCRGVS